jgi:small-conductance mechanosensitive channel
MLGTLSSTDWGTALTQLLFNNPAGDWLLALGVMLATMLGLNLLQRWLAKLITIPPKGQAASPLRKLISRVIARTSMIFLCGMGVVAGANMLALPEVVSHALGFVAFVVIAIQVAIWTTQIIGVAISHYTETRLHVDKDSVTTLNLLSMLARGAVWVVTLLLILSNLGVNITAFVASLGIGGVALALASQKLLGDFVSGLTIMVDRPFGIGDYIVVGNHAGTVQYIGVKSTRIRSRTGEDLIISNGKLLDEIIMNHHGVENRRSTIVVALQHGTAPSVMEAFPDKLERIIRDNPHLELSRARCTAITQDGVEFTIIFKVRGGDFDVYATQNQTVLLAIYRLCHEERIRLARPLRVVEDKEPQRSAMATRLRGRISG